MFLERGARGQSLSLSRWFYFSRSCSLSLWLMKSKRLSWISSSRSFFFIRGSHDFFLHPQPSTLFWMPFLAFTILPSCPLVCEYVRIILGCLLAYLTVFSLLFPTSLFFNPLNTLSSNFSSPYIAVITCFQRFSKCLFSHTCDSLHVISNPYTSSLRMIQRILRRDCVSNDDVFKVTG